MPNKPVPDNKRSPKKAGRGVDSRTAKLLIKHGQARDNKNEMTRGSIKRARPRHA